MECNLFWIQHKERCDYPHGDFDLKEQITAEEKYNKINSEILENETLAILNTRDTFVQEIQNMILENG